MNLIYLVIRTSRVRLIFAVIAGIVSGASSTAVIALLNAALSGAVGGTSILAVSFIGLVLLMVSSNVTSQLLLTRLSQGAILDLRMRLSRRILVTPLQQVEKIGTPHLLSALTDDVFVITSALLSIPTLCVNVATIAVGLSYLAWLSVDLLLLVCGIVALGIVVYLTLTKEAERYFKGAREEQGALFGAFRALTEGLKELKLHRRRRQAFLSSMLEQTAESLRRYNLAGMDLYTAAGVWGQLLFYAFIGGIVFLVPLFRQAGADILTGYTLTILFIWGPIGSLLSVFPTLARAKIALQKIETLGLALTESAPESRQMAANKPANSWRRLELAGVTHSYAGEDSESKFALGPIDLVFQPAEIVFLVGGNGSGKTTFAKLLTGLYAPESGEIRLDGQLITEEMRERYRQLFSAVFADFYLFDKLIGLEQQELDERAGQYLADFQLDHKVRIENGKLSTINLSQGQRRRLALLTVYLEDRSFYVFDEWAADQDPQFRETFYTAILPDLRQRGKAVLVITHDERYFHLADRVIKLNYGQLSFISNFPLIAQTRKRQPHPIQRSSVN
jgi:putative ATP-binding cassette transporter